MNYHPRLVFVGGFLGAGKTTLLAQAARRLLRQDKKVGLVTNDQAAGLVDTGVLKRAASGIGEVSGGCFCCKFGGLISSLKALFKEITPDVVLGEPVGSCTDISATVLQPIKKMYGDLFALAPYTVLADPYRLKQTLGEGDQPLARQTANRLPENVAYIYQKQLEEADVIALNKADLLGAGELEALKAAVAGRFPEVTVLGLSALKGDGLDRWLDLVMQEGPAGRRVTDVDYNRYADGEAMLGWLNAAVLLEAADQKGKGDQPLAPVDWSRFCRALLGRVREGCRERAAEIAHLKVLLEAEGEHLAGNLTSTANEPVLRGSIDGKRRRARLLVNARVRIGPGELREVVEESLRSSAGEQVRAEVTDMRSFCPARPEPTFRFNSAF